MSISTENRNLAVYLRSVLGGIPKVARFWDDEEHRNTDVLTVSDVPVAGVSTYSTIGLSDTPVGLMSGDLALRVELLFALATAYERSENIVASCAFSVMNGEVTPKPGAIITRVIELYHTGDSALRHILLVSPFLWKVETQKFTKKAVAWLQAIPISDGERSYALKKGSDALEEIFEQCQIDVFNLNRPSVL